MPVPFLATWAQVGTRRGQLPWTDSARYLGMVNKSCEILAFQDVQLLDVAGPLQVFASANNHARAAGEPRPYELATVAERPLVTAMDRKPGSAAAVV